jgi:hypothetical protein
MPNNLPPTLVKILKIGGIILGGVVVVGAGAFVYLGITSDKGFGLFIPDAITEALKGPTGCCLPNCEAKREAECTDPESTTFSWTSSQCEDLSECEEGCCYPYGNLPKAACDHIAGEGVWQDGECKGFKVTTEGTTTHNFSGTGLGEWFFTLDVYSCDEDPYNATWQGSWHLDYYYTDEGGIRVLAQTREGNTSFTTVEGNASFAMESETVTVAVDSTNMRIYYHFDEVGEDITSRGTIVMDDSKCE